MHKSDWCTVEVLLKDAKGKKDDTCSREVDKVRFSNIMRFVWIRKDKKINRDFGSLSLLPVTSTYDPHPLYISIDQLMLERRTQRTRGFSCSPLPYSLLTLHPSLSYILHLTFRSHCLDSRLPTDKKRFSWFLHTPAAMAYPPPVDHPFLLYQLKKHRSPPLSLSLWNTNLLGPRALGPHLHSAYKCTVSHPFTCKLQFCFLHDLQIVNFTFCILRNFVMILLKSKTFQNERKNSFAFIQYSVEWTKKGSLS
jgi:hypothetical protein